MRVTVTAVCTFCANRFDVTPDIATLPYVSLVCDDGDGRLCCNDCFHEGCGRGHVTQADRDECDSELAFPDEPGDTWSYQMLRVS